MPSFLLRHAPDDGLGLLHLLLGAGQRLFALLRWYLPHPRQHLQQAAHRTELLHLLHLCEKIFQRQRLLAQRLLGLRQHLHIHRRLRLLDEADDIAHAKNA